MIQLYSTQNKNIQVSLEDAVLRGLADDGGLFMPYDIPKMPASFFQKISSLTFPEIAFEVSHNLLRGSVPTQALQMMVEKAMNFEIVLKKLSSEIYALELFHGPTLSFKDFGARFMAQLLGYFVQNKNQKIHILVATSGDTGSAIADAFLNVPGIQVWILYPKGKISFNQEKQLTTLGHNISVLEVEGTFDDCQKLVRQAFSDPRLRQKLTLTSANSINIARLIPQASYYFYPYAKIEKKAPFIVSVPSGNFGNLMAGLLAKKMGLPIAHFVAATNINDTVPKYINTGVFEPNPSKHTLSNAMDVGNPSNFARLQDFYAGDLLSIRQEIDGVSFTDEQTEKAMQEVFSKYGYLLDPHGAVGYLGLQNYLQKNSSKLQGVFLETAHPAKFAEDVLRITGQKVAIPKNLQETLSKEKQTIPISAKYEDLFDLLITNS